MEKIPKKYLCAGTDTYGEVKHGDRWRCRYCLRLISLKPGTDRLAPHRGMRLVKDDE